MSKRRSGGGGEFVLRVVTPGSGPASLNTPASGVTRERGVGIKLPRVFSNALGHLPQFALQGEESWSVRARGGDADFTRWLDFAQSARERGQFSFLQEFLARFEPPDNPGVLQGSIAEVRHTQPDSPSFVSVKGT
jgi:hypothetical protein